MIYGFDLGSRYVKVAALSGKEQLDFYKYDTISFYKNYSYKATNSLIVDFPKLGLEKGTIVSTGYGRNTVDIQGGREISEIKAHLYGARWQTGLENFTLLDLGGQDSKVLQIRKGKIIEFQTNDKCAASSGRYLENMAQVLGISLEELSGAFEDPVDLDATCAIFGESELIGKIIEGHSITSLAAGVNYTIFRRVKPLLRQLASETLVFTGGVARNQALKVILEKELGVRVVVPRYPQYNGAIGCCIFDSGLLE